MTFKVSAFLGYCFPTKWSPGDINVCMYVYLDGWTDFELSSSGFLLVVLAVLYTFRFTFLTSCQHCLTRIRSTGHCCCLFVTTFQNKACFILVILIPYLMFSVLFCFGVYDLKCLIVLLDKNTSTNVASASRLRTQMCLFQYFTQI